MTWQFRRSTQQPHIRDFFHFSRLLSSPACPAPLVEHGNLKATAMALETLSLQRSNIIKHQKTFAFFCGMVYVYIIIYIISSNFLENWENCECDHGTGACALQAYMGEAFQCPSFLGLQQRGNASVSQRVLSQMQLLQGRISLATALQKWVQNLFSWTSSLIQLDGQFESMEMCLVGIGQSCHWFMSIDIQFDVKHVARQSVSWGNWPWRLPSISICKPAWRP